MADEPFLLVRSAVADLRDGGRIAPHTHDWHQLIYVGAGLAVVRAGHGTWLAPPNWAVWVPAGTDHAIRFIGRSALRTLYLRPEWRAGLPSSCGALAVSPLLRELVLRASATGMLDGRDEGENALAVLIASEIREGGTPAVALPEPTSAATIAAAERAVPGHSPESTASIARAVGLSPRTLERRFLAETGMAFGRWRQHRRLLLGLEQIATGAPVKIAAAGAGYASSSAYVAAFRSLFATTPGRYFRH